MNIKKSIITITSVALLSLGVSAFAETSDQIATSSPVTKHIIRHEIKKDVMKTSSMSKSEKKEDATSTMKKSHVRRMSHKRMNKKSATTTNMLPKTTTN